MPNGYAVFTILKFTIHISDPAYTDIYFLDPTDWNVYIDNSYAFVTPTWTNPWYWNYTWAPYSYSSLSWRWNFGFGSWGFSWGYGYPGWGYNPYWGLGRTMVSALGLGRSSPSPRLLSWTSSRMGITDGISVIRMVDERLTEIMVLQIVIVEEETL